MPRDPHDKMQKGRPVAGSPNWRSPCNLDMIRSKVKSGEPGTLPVDLPMHLIIERVMGIFGLDDQPTHEVHGLLGHSIGMDFYTKGIGSGTFVEINVYRDPNAIKIEVNGEEVFRWVEDGSELPLRTHDAIDELRRVGGEFVDQVDLQPGDFVGPGNEITRATDDDDEVLVFDDEEIIFEEEDEDADFIES